MRVDVVLWGVLHFSLAARAQLFDQFSGKFGLHALGTRDDAGLDGGCHSEEPNCRLSSSGCPPGQRCSHVTSCDLSGDGGSFDACAQPDGSPGFCCHTEDPPADPLGGW